MAEMKCAHLVDDDENDADGTVREHRADHVSVTEEATNTADDEVYLENESDKDSTDGTNIKGSCPLSFQRRIQQGLSQARRRAGRRRSPGY